MSVLINYCLNEIKNFNYFSVSGHANYDEIGKDIVCSAISGITNGSINFLISNYSNFCNFNFKNEGFEVFVCKKNSEVNLCLKIMLYQLQNIQKFYPQHLQIKKITNNKINCDYGNTK